MKKNFKLNEYDRELLEDVRGQKVYCNITRVSQSGMTRKMRFYAVSKKDSELRDITYLISGIADYNTDKNHDLIVSGCGMDMVFSVLSNFNYSMARLDTGKNITVLLESKECGDRIYDKYFLDANNYGTL